jgi:predicted metal-dependent phosphoesterase TrpH
VTDHDSVAGIERAREAAATVGVEVVPGAEMSSNVEGTDVHILGYYLDHRDPEVLEMFDRLKEAREERARQMVEKMTELGMAVPMERVLHAARGGAVGRPHVAQAMVEAGVVPTQDLAFRRYIGYDGPAYVPKMKLSPSEAVSFIKGHGGVAVLAHPGIYRRESALYSSIAAGVDGIEVWHPDHNATDEEHLLEVAEKNGLLTTGGSDCHGGRKGGHIYLGEVAVPYKHLAAVKRLSRSRRS